MSVAIAKSESDNSLYEFLFKMIDVVAPIFVTATAFDNALNKDKILSLEKRLHAYAKVAIISPMSIMERGLTQ